MHDKVLTLLHELRHAAQDAGIVAYAPLDSRETLRSDRHPALATKRDGLEDIVAIPDQPRSDKDPVAEIGKRATFTGWLVIAAIMVGQVIVGAQVTAESDPQGMFVNVLLFTWPLSIAVALGVVGFARYSEDLSSGWNSAFFVGALAVGAFLVATALAGQAIDYTPENIGGPGNVLGVIAGVLNGFMAFYGLPVFLGALVAGAGVAWIYLDVIDPATAA